MEDKIHISLGQQTTAVVRRCVYAPCYSYGSCQKEDVERFMDQKSLKTYRAHKLRLQHACMTLGLRCDVV